MEIMLDSHTWWKTRNDAYDFDTVKSLVEFSAENGAYWIEEPVAPVDHDGYRELANRGIPLAGGESEETAEDLLELGRTGAIDFLQGDVRHHVDIRAAGRRSSSAMGRTTSRTSPTTSVPGWGSLRTRALSQWHPALNSLSIPSSRTTR